MRVEHLKLLFPLAAITAAMLSSTVAIAQDRPLDGAYAGIEAGLGSLKAKGSTLIGPFKETDDAVMANVVIGARTSLGESMPVIIGVEANAGSYTGDAGARYGISGIAGFRLGERGLAYGKVGQAWLDGVDRNARKNLDGLLLGGGYEHALGERLSLRAEYRHLDLGGINFIDNRAKFKADEFAAGVLMRF